MSIFKRHLTQADYFLIVANLIPVAGAIFWNWDAKEIFLVYCLQTIIIGILNVIRMAIVTIARKRDTWYNEGSTTQQSGLFFIFFFIVHYGMFVGIQMGIFFGVSGIGAGQDITAFNFFYKWPRLLTNDSIIMLIGFTVGYGFKMLYNFIRNGEYKTAPLMLLMFQPYGRIFIQQFTVIVGSIFLSFGAGIIFIIIFAAVQILFEVYANFDRLLAKSMADMKKKSGEE